MFPQRLTIIANKGNQDAVALLIRFVCNNPTFAECAAKILFKRLHKRYLPLYEEQVVEWPQVKLVSTILQSSLTWYLDYGDESLGSFIHNRWLTVQTWVEAIVDFCLEHSSVAKPNTSQDWLHWLVDVLQLNYEVAAQDSF